MTDERRTPDDPRADTGLWDLVAAVPVPAAGADFLPRLEVRLAPAAPRVAPQPGTVVPVPRVRSRRRLVSLLAATAAVAAAAAVLALVVLPSLKGPETATAADVLVSMNAVGGARIVDLRLVQTERSGLTNQRIQKRMTQDLTLSVTGDYRGDCWVALDGTDAVTSDFGYDAARHEMRYASAASSDGVQVLYPEWPTHIPEVWTNYLGYKAAASSVRALLAEMDPKTPVEETICLGRPAWKATLPDSWPGAPGTTVTVDKATGLLLETRRSGKDENGKPYLDVLRVTQFETNPRLKADWQVVPLLKKPGKALKWNYFFDNGVRFGSLAAVAGRAWPTLPLIPAWIPDGYGPAALANAVYEDSRESHDEDNSWHWGTDLVRPTGRLPGSAVITRLALKRCAQGVLIMYRRGFDTFTVEITPRKPKEPGMGALDKESRVTMQDTVLTGGYLKGARARTWLSSALLPVEHVWGDSMEVASQGPTLLTYSDRSQVAIYGDLTRQELIDVADSLQIYGDATRPLPAGYGD